MKWQTKSQSQKKAADKEKNPPFTHPLDFICYCKGLAASYEFWINDLLLYHPNEILRLKQALFSWNKYYRMVLPR